MGEVVGDAWCDECDACEVGAAVVDVGGGDSVAQDSVRAEQADPALVDGMLDSMDMVPDKRR